MSPLSQLEAAALATLISEDQAIATALFNDLEDVTISAHCGVIKLLDSRDDFATLTQLGVGMNETRICVALADALEDIQAGHCQGAIDGDLARAKAAQTYLAPYGSGA